MESSLRPQMFRQATRDETQYHALAWDPLWELQDEIRVVGLAAAQIATSEKQLSSINAHNQSLPSEKRLQIQANSTRQVMLVGSYSRAM